MSPKGLLVRVWLYNIDYLAWHAMAFWTYLISGDEFFVSLITILSEIFARVVAFRVHPLRAVTSSVLLS